MPRSVITSKFQTTVPKEVRKHLGISVADELCWEVRGGQAVVTVATPAFLGRRGSIDGGLLPVEAVRRMRARRGTR